MASTTSLQPLTNDDLAVNRESAWNVYEQLKNAIRTQSRLFLIQGQLFKQIRDEKLYKYLGEGGYDNFGQFLNNPEIGVRKSTVYLYIHVFEYYIQQLKLNEEEVLNVPLNRLQRLLSPLRELSDEEASKKLQEVGSLTNYDFDVHARENNIDKDRPMLVKCKECQGWKFEYRDSSMCHCEGSSGIIDKAMFDK